MMPRTLVPYPSRGRSGTPSAVFGEKSSSATASTEWRIRRASARNTFSSHRRDRGTVVTCQEERRIVDPQLLRSARWWQAVVASMSVRHAACR